MDGKGGLQENGSMEGSRFSVGHWASVELGWVQAVK